jgi:phosphoglycolate phosphatase
MIAVLWDLDGTLADTAGDIADAIDHVLAAQGLPAVGEAAVRRYIGDGARQLVDRCWAHVGARATPEDARAFLACYGERLVVRTRVHPPELRALLTRIDAPQAIVTNKPEHHARHVVDALGLTPHFPVLLGGDTLPTRKPDPAMLREALVRLGATRGVLVGDGPADVDAAHAAGMPVIGVDWGIGTPEGATVRVADVPSLAEALARFGVPLG